MIKIKFADKDFPYYWNVIKIPFLLLISWIIFSIVVAKISMYWYNSIFTGWTAFVPQIAIFGFVGYIIIAEHKGEIRHSAWAGAITGALAGFVGAILAIIMVYFVPEIIEQAVAQAVASGAPEALVRKMTMIGLYIGFVTGPLVSGIFGAIISSIAGFITKKAVSK